MSSRDEKIAVVTGASSGIGRGTALLLAKRGYRLVLIARREDRLRQVAEESDLSDKSDRSDRSDEVGDKNHVVMPADLENEQAAGKAATEVVERFPMIDLFIHCAGYGIYKPFLELTPAEERALMNLHFGASSTFIRAILPGMLKAGSGHIVNVASVAICWGPAGHSVYAAAKSALVAMTQSLACDYAGRGVHFSCVYPGIVRTEFFENESYRGLKHQADRHGIEPEVVARKIVGLLDRPRPEVFVPASHRILAWIHAVSPSLTRKLITSQSAPRS
jgi:hypothetical protein